MFICWSFCCQIFLLTSSPSAFRVRCCPLQTVAAATVPLHRVSPGDHTCLFWFLRCFNNFSHTASAPASVSGCSWKLAGWHFLTSVAVKVVFLFSSAKVTRHFSLSRIYNATGSPRPHPKTLQLPLAYPVFVIRSVLCTFNKFLLNFWQPTLYNFIVVIILPFLPRITYIKYQFFGIISCGLQRFLVPSLLSLITGCRREVALEWLHKPWPSAGPKTLGQQRAGRAAWEYEEKGLSMGLAFHNWHRWERVDWQIVCNY